MCVLCAAACFLCAGQCFVRFVCLGTFGLGLCVIGWVFLRIKAFPCLGGGTRAEACQVWRFLRSPVHLNRIFLSFLRSFFSINRSQTNVNSRSSLCPSVVPFSRCSRPCFFSRALSSLSRFFCACRSLQVCHERSTAAGRAGGVFAGPQRNGGERSSEPMNLKCLAFCLP